MATSIDHVVQSVKRLLWQLRDRPNFKGIAESVGAELNELETMFAELAALAVATEEGIQLDRDGALVGVGRNGRSDLDYRAAIEAQIRINQGKALISDVLLALEQAGPTISWELTEPQAAVVRVTTTTALGVGSAPSAGNIAGLLDALLGAGIAHALLYSLTTAALTFTLADADTVQVSSSQGCANDARSTGGRLADAAGESTITVPGTLLVDDISGDTYLDDITLESVING